MYRKRFLSKSSEDVVLFLFRNDITFLFVIIKYFLASPFLTNWRSDEDEDEFTIIIIRYEVCTLPQEDEERNFVYKRNILV